MGSKRDVTDVPAETGPSPVRIEFQDGAALVVVDNPPVNAASTHVRRALVETLETLSRRSDLTGLVLIGAGSTFMAGADLKEFDRTPEKPLLSSVVAALECCPLPVVAAIHGHALGGGLELALGCDARICTPDARVGFPEVGLGIIPGAGGTQRLPRLVGVAHAIEIISSGRRLGATEAYRLGIVDEIVSGDLRQAAVAYLATLAGEKRRLADRPVEAEDPALIAEAKRLALRGRKRAAVGEAVAAVEESAGLALTEGLAREREAFQRLRASPEAKALRYLFFSERRAGRPPEGATPREIRDIGVVGAGKMGRGMSAALALAGFRVRVADRDPAIAEASVSRIVNLTTAAAERGQIPPDDAEAACRRVEAVAGIDDLADSDFVIETVPEDQSLKREVLATLDRTLRPDALLASNSTHLDVDRLADATSRPAQVVGLHFFSPAQSSRLVEVMRGSATSSDTLASVLQVMRRMGKVAVVCASTDGFIGNRIFNAYRRQCEFLVEEGAEPVEVDTAMVEFGMRLGPFAACDLAGLDGAWRTRRPGKRETKVRYAEAADRLCEMGRLGVKTGAGWYEYGTDARRGEPDPEVHKLLEEIAERKDIDRRTISAAEIQARAVGAMLNEAALILSKDIAERASDIDLVMVHGYGFPAEKGGPLYWAANQPIAEILTAVDGLLEASGFGFERGNIEKMLAQVPA